MVRVVESPVGLLKLSAEGDALTGVWLNAKGVAARDKATGVMAEVERQLAAYFAGRLKTFDLKLAPAGTPFQLACWSALQTIPYGVTWSYGQLAHHIGKPDAVRAVGAANGQNPIPIIIPCHRVIGANGKLVGFGGGLEMKKWLLALEGKQPLLEHL
jgi:methylated-DNA-[protein]-cysteine S-methyltransferase